MAKKSVRSAYVPHARVTAPNMLLNHKTGEFFKPVTRVKQSFVAECDINNILKQYSASGQLKHISAKAQLGTYQNLPDDLDFQEAQNIVAQAKEAFATLPAKTRDRFNNDPTNFLEFMSDPDNQGEAIKLGLATKRATDALNEPQAPSTPPKTGGAPDGSGNAPAANS